MEAPFNPQYPADREKLRRLFKVKQTEGAMLLTRGYILEKVYMMKSNREFVSVDLSGLQNPNVTFDTFLAFRDSTKLFQSRQEFSSIYVNRDQTKQVLVLYLGNEPGKQVATKDFQIVNEFIQTSKFHDIILVTETGLIPGTMNIVRNLTAGYNIEVFLDYELAFNRTKHAYAPIKTQHISNKEVIQWSTNEGFQSEKLPLILTSDPQAKWYGAKPFDGFQMTLVGTEADTIEYYRITRMTPTVKK